MNNFITLACPSCGASLRVSSSTNSLKCDYCGHEHVVRRQGGAIEIEQKITWICPQCGTPASSGTGFCPNCGFPLASNCPNCMKRVYINAIYCPECGVNITETKQQTHIRQKERQRRRGEIDLEIIHLNNEIAQKRLEMSKLPRRGPIITTIGVLSLFFLCLSMIIMGSSIDSSTGNFSLATYALGIPGFALFVVFSYYEINRNKTIDQNKNRNASEEYKLKNRISELQEELGQID